MLIDEVIAAGLPARFPSGNRRMLQVVQRLAEFGDHGATDNELIASFEGELGASTVRPRRIDLSNDGWVVDSGVRRANSLVRQLSDEARKVFSPSFTAADLSAVAGASGTATSALNRRQGAALDRIRRSLAQLIRVGYRAALEQGIHLEEAISLREDAANRIVLPQSGWLEPAELAGSGAADIVLTADDGGVRFALLFGAPNEAEADDLAEMRRRARAHALTVGDEILSIIESLVTDGWELDPPQDEQASDPIQSWVDALALDDSHPFTITRSWTKSEVDALGYDIGGLFQQFVGDLIQVLQRMAGSALDPVEVLVETLYWSRDRAQALVDLANRSRQLLFAGPPGTGKTFAARALARAMASGGLARVMQFHPTYAYEDFVEGIRPVLAEPDKVTDDHASGDAELNDGNEDPPAAKGLMYELRKGILREVVLDAERAQDEPVFLIIDEINRANLPRVLGELLFALEYRGPGNEVLLPYSGDAFTLPLNLWIIGTMNTADRSVAVVDAAMRRRFKQVRFPVDYDALVAWHAERTTVELGEAAAKRLLKLNEILLELLDVDRLVGHSYLMREDLETIGWQVIWDEDLEPVLHDHLLGQLDELGELRNAFLDAT